MCKGSDLLFLRAGMGSSDEWTEIPDITPEAEMYMDPRVYGGGNRYHCLPDPVHSIYEDSKNPCTPHLQGLKDFHSQDSGFTIQMLMSRTIRET